MENSSDNFELKFNTLLESLFDELYDAAEKIINEEKPCEHKVTKRGHVCLGKVDKKYGYNRPECCCAGCQHFKNGCTAEKPLTCKCWLCPVAIRKHPDTWKKLNELNNLVKYFGFYLGRGTKEESLLNSISYYVSPRDFRNHTWNYENCYEKLIEKIKKSTLLGYSIFKKYLRN